MNIITLKKIFSVLSIIALQLALSNGLKAQSVSIPDANFKAYLLGNKDINTNSDQEIQFSEASAFKGRIEASQKNIADLTQITQ